MKYTSTKLYEGYSACFRQWRAEGTHCKFLHGYAVSFEVVFEGALDEKNWVFDFGGMKRSEMLIEGMKPNDFFNWLLDHTTIVAEDDPELKLFKELDKKGVIQLRVLKDVGCERFAEYLFYKIANFVMHETNSRVTVKQVTVFENNKNSATFKHKIK